MFAALVFVTGVVFAQDAAARFQEPAPTSVPAAEDRAAATAAVRAARLAFDDPDFVSFDQPEADGPWWVRGGNFKASFGADGWQFVPQPDAAAEELQPLRFHLDGVRVGGQALAVADAPAQRQDRRFAYDHGDVLQTIDVGGRGVEQRFTFRELPRRGELVVDLAVATALAGEATADGIAFRGPHDHVTYANAVAVDARGRRSAAATTWADGHIAIRVPAAFVEAAELPLVIDPFVAVAFVATSSTDLADPDVAFLTAVRLNQPTTFWNVVYARFFGGSDWDCYLQLLDANMALVDAPLPIDITSNSWQRPRIASTTRLDPMLMVVAQVRSGTAPFKVSARRAVPPAPLGAWVLGPQFDVAVASVDSLHPDIGGDTSDAFRSHFFTVVWEHAFSPTDHDIYARQIDSAGTLRNGGPTFVQTSFLNQTWPSISKTCGPEPLTGSSADQRFTIVYQQTASARNEDIYGALLTWDGVSVPVPGGTTFPIDTSPERDVLPQVGPPTVPDGNGTRRILVVYERSSTGNGDICAATLDVVGNVWTRGNLSALEGDPVRLPWPQHAPSVDSDGLRFCVGYHEVAQGNTNVNDTDTRATLVGITRSGAILVEEPGALLRATGNREFNVQVAAQPGSSRFCTTNDRDNVNATFVVDACTYQGVPQLAISTRHTGCGLAGLSSVGNPVLGATLRFTTGGALISGFVAGAPVNAPVLSCTACTLGAQGVTVFGAAMTITIPEDPGFLGMPLSVQAFTFVQSGGGCLGQLNLSDTFDCVVH